MGRPLSRRVIYILLAAILATTFAVYAPTLGYSFVYDDHAQLQENPWLRSWNHLSDYFTQRTWAHMPVAATFYRPLFMVWMNANYQVFQEHAWGWHLSTVLLHVLATALAFILVECLVGNSWIALITAAIFGLHPAHIESVAWIAGVTDPLMFVFFAAAWICERKASKSAKPVWWMILSCVFFAASLLIKETAIVLPVLIFAVKLGETQNVRRAATTVVPFVLVTIAYLATRLHVLQQFAEPLQKVTVKQSILTAPSLLWFYLGHLVLPAPLSGFYDLPIVSGVGASQVLLPCVALVAFLLVVIFISRRVGSAQLGLHVLIALLLLFLPLAPLLNLSVLQEYNFVHDRYLYLPCLGFGLLVATVLIRLSKHGAFLAGALVVALSLGTVLQESIWRDDASLYLNGVRNAPGNPIPATNLAAILVRLHRYDDALKILTPALARSPGFWAVYANLADCYAGMGDPARASDFYLQAYQRLPDYRFLQRAAEMRQVASKNGAIQTK